MLKQILKKLYRGSVSLSASVFGWPLVVRSLVLIKGAQEDSNEKTGLFENIFHQQKFQRSKPIVTQPLHWKFLPKALGTTELEAPVSGRILTNARILGPSGTIVNNKSQLVYDASSEICLLPETHSVFNRVVYAKPVIMAGMGMNLCASQSERNYFHWMTDALPKLAIAKAIGYGISAFDYFVVNSRSQGYQQETLKALKIPAEKVIALDEHPYIKCQSLLATSATCDSGNVSGWIINYMRENFLPATKKTSPGRKIFVCRRNAIWRRLLNEPEIINYLRAKGFEEVYLEEMTVAAQAEMFANADIVVASHGAGLTNIAFCSPGTHVIELFPPTYVNQGYWTMASDRKLNYYYIIGSGIEIADNHDLLRNSDFSVSVDQLEAHLLQTERQALREL